MSQVEEDDVLTTVVGRISPTESFFSGHDVREVIGLGYWQLISLSVGGPTLDASAIRVMDSLTACMVACDPRIWPLKLVQLGACYGRMSSGVGTGVIGMEPSMLSYWTAGSAAELQRRLRDELGSRSTEEIGECLPNGGVPGFGVYGREGDLRVSMFREWRCRSELPSGPFELMLEPLERAVRVHRRQALRIDGLAAAVLLDVGFTPRQIAVMAGLVQGLPNILANAYEGSQRGSALQQIRKDKVVYTGAPPRRSQRSSDEGR